jgi:hypothetical protein
VKVAAAIIFLLLNPVVAFGSADVRWVHGSWVNIRDEASSTGAIIAHLPTNTEVKVFSNQGEWCEIGSRAIHERGFVVCKLLGKKPFSLFEVTNPELPNYSPLRAFWIAPSLQRLLLAGDSYEETMLSQQQRKSEVRNDLYRKEDLAIVKIPKRPKIPEYDAMKDLFISGVVPSRESLPVFELNEDLFALLTKKLGPVTPSLFKEQSDLSPYSSLEHLGAKFNIPVQLRVLSGAKWVYEPRGPSVSVVGAWDVGDVELVLKRPVIEYVIGRNGVATAMEWRGPERRYAAEGSLSVWYEAGSPDALGSDSPGSAFSRGARPLPGYPKVEDELVRFYMEKPLPYKKVSINKRRHADFNCFYMDVNGDAINDLVTCERENESEGNEPISERHVMVNISGKWQTMSSEYSEGHPGGD